MKEHLHKTRQPKPTLNKANVKNVLINAVFNAYTNKAFTIDKKSIILSFQKTTFYNGECYYSRQ